MRIAIALLVCSACGGESDFNDCRIGELTGAWRVSYAETDGDCGPIPDETSVFGGEPADGCVEHSFDVSADKCEGTSDTECPLADGLGTQRWVVVFKQVAEDELSGSGTVQVDHPDLGVCRSTYDMTAIRL